MDMPRNGNITTTGVTYAPTFSNAGSIVIYGELTLGGITWTTPTTYFGNRTGTTLTSGGTVFTGNISIEVYLSDIILADALTVTGSITLLKGTLNTMGYAVTAATFDASTTTDIRGLDLSSSTVTLNGTAVGNKWAAAASGGTFTFYDNTSLIYLTQAAPATSAQIFVGAGLQNYNNITIGGTGAYQMTLTGSNKFVDFVVDRSTATKTVVFTTGTTTSVAGLGIANSTPAGTMVILKSSSTTPAYISRSSGIISVDYVTIQYVIATGGASFYTGTHSTIQNGVLSAAAGVLPATPIILYESVNGSIVDLNLPTVASAGTITATIGAGGYSLVGTARDKAGSTVTVVGSVKTLVAGVTTFTTGGSYPGIIDVRTTGSGWNPSIPTPPAIATAAASGIASVTVTGNATMAAGGMGAYSLVFLFFQTSLTGAFAGEQVNSTEQTVAAPGSFSQLISGLVVDTPYHYRAALRYNVVEFVYAPTDLDFTTSGKPEVATGSTAGVTYESATLQASLVAIGVYTLPDYCYFEYSKYLYTDPLYIAGDFIATLEQPLSIVTGYHADIASLIASTTYYYRAVCRYINAGSKWVYGTQLTFVTDAATPPTITTLAATDVVDVTVTLQGTMDTGIYGTVYIRFEYGPDPTYGHTSAWQTFTTDSAFSAPIVNLVPDTTYYFRGAGQYGAGINVYGSQLTFKTTIVAGSGTDQSMGRDRDVLPDTSSSDWFREPDVSGTLMSNPLRPLVTLVSDPTTLTELQVWRLYALIMILFFTMLAANSLPDHLLVAGIAAGATIGAAVALTIFPMWSLVFAIGCIGGGLVAERTAQL
jgi:hypothetical protein